MECHLGPLLRAVIEIRLLRLLTVAFIVGHSSDIVLATGVTSKVIIKDQDGDRVGPQISLSSTVLKTDETLEYTCIENSDAESNRLTRISRGDVTTDFDNSQHEGGRLYTRVCKYPDRRFWCMITKGSIKWKKEYGGKYCCSAALDDCYYIHWIDPVIHVPGNRDLNRQQYGSTQTFYCAVDMTPTDIPYNDIFKVTWQWMGASTDYSWEPVPLSSTVTSTHAPRGPNVTLTIRNFNPIKHGGEYRCLGKVERYDPAFTSSRFKLDSQPKATLGNNKRREFVFGKHERDVKFRCEALSYPFPEKIEFKLQSVVLDGNTKGVSDYETDIISTSVNVHKTTFTVKNLTEVFHNDSVFECRVFRRGDSGPPAISQQRIILVEEASPVETTTSFMLPPVTKRHSPTEHRKRPGLSVRYPLQEVLKCSECSAVSSSSSLDGIITHYFLYIISYLHILAFW